MDWLLSPRTDAGVAAQLVALVAVVAAAVWRLRARPGPRLVAVGAGMVLLGLLALRAVH